MKFTPEKITELSPNQIFVFGANERGLHGAGAAKTALHWGAVIGKYGLMGQTYGLPTKDENIRTLPLKKIESHVIDFLLLVQKNEDKQFLLTRVGCGLAGYKDSQIANIFAKYVPLPQNLTLPKEFHNIIYVSVQKSLDKTKSLQ